MNIRLKPDATWLLKPGAHVPWWRQMVCRGVRLQPDHPMKPEA
jgi:hypothetical protein